MTQYNCSTAAQYAALARAMRTRPTPSNPEPRSISDLEGLGRYTGAAWFTPVRDYVGEVKDTISLTETVALSDECAVPA